MPTRAAVRALLLAPFVLAAAARADDKVPPPPEPSAAAVEPRGLRLRDPRAFPGYTLVCPLTSLRTVLLDLDGRIAHEWKSDLPPGNSVFLQDDGTIVRCGRISDGGVFEGGGIGGKVQRIAWDGTVLWDFRWADEAKHHHHDVEVLPNGNVLLISWERKSDTAAVLAGRDPALMESGELWPDAVFEIRPVGPSGGEVVWEWHVWDHLIQDFSPDRANFGDVAAHPERVDLNADRMYPKPPEDVKKAEEEKLRQTGYAAGTATGKKGKPRNVRGADWLHTNGIDYQPELDLIVLSVPRFDEMWVIDHSTTTAEARGGSGGRHGKGGDLLHRYGNPQAHRHGGPADRRLFRQHDAQWIDAGLPGAGNLLVFNNGGEPRPGGAHSTVDEIAFPPSDTAPLVWTYGEAEGQRFHSSFISGAERLSNGNTLICSGEQGRILEVTADGAIVWEYWNEIGGDAPKEDGPPSRINPFALFRATRIAADHPGLAALRAAGLPAAR